MLHLRCGKRRRSVLWQHKHIVRDNALSRRLVKGWARGRCAWSSISAEAWAQGPGLHNTPTDPTPSAWHAVFWATSSAAAAKGCPAAVPGIGLHTSLVPSVAPRRAASSQSRTWAAYDAIPAPAHDAAGLMLGFFPPATAASAPPLLRLRLRLGCLYKSL
jgi:hypothetical protein